jgi:hypothetical protein
MDGSWPSRVLTGPRYVRVDLNPQGGNHHGYYVRVVYRGGQLRGIVRRVGSDFSHQRVGSARVSRPNGFAVKVNVRRGVIKARRSRSVLWGAQTHASGNYDVAPSPGGAYRHPI